MLLRQTGLTVTQTSKQTNAACGADAHTLNTTNKR